ncbi:MAG: polyprenyl synthetase family protein [Cyanobacteriota bacterium]|nr:polyprenyl synthetase family protein [Cyanobacteriota bacterium]
MMVETFNLTDYLVTRQQWVEQALSDSIPIVYPERIYESMRYSLLAGGKRLRPILCLASCELAQGEIAQAMPTACALEMIHTMSLIHDDLPSMDNDDYRRGKLTNHKVYGEDMAILAGDALLAYAFQYIAQQTQNVPPERVLEVIGRLGQAVAASGLVGGQVVDLESEGKPISLETLEFIHTHKTGALLEISVVSGSILAGADLDMIERLTGFAREIGLAFQIIDDILDITATSEQLGKTAGKDQAVAKATYPSLWGLEFSRQKAEELVVSAKHRLDPYGEKAQPLLALADYITHRTH